MCTLILFMNIMGCVSSTFQLSIYLDLKLNPIQIYYPKTITMIDICTIGIFPHSNDVNYQSEVLRF